MPCYFDYSEAIGPAKMPVGALKNLS